MVARPRPQSPDLILQVVDPSLLLPSAHPSIPANVPNLRLECVDARFKRSTLVPVVPPIAISIATMLVPVVTPIPILIAVPRLRGSEDSGHGDRGG
jgi:hypothetical protein